MKVQRLKQSCFAASILLHLAILMPFMEMPHNEKMSTEPCITFSIKTAVAKQQERPSPPEQSAKIKKVKWVPVKEKRAKSPEKQIPTPLTPVQSSSGDSPPLTRQEPATPSSLTLPSQETPVPQSGKYLSIVRNRIEEKKHYPPFARNLQHEGTVTVNVTIGISGAIISATVIRSSGYASLDRAALEAVRKAGPFPPPTGYGLEQMNVSVPLIFKLI